MPEQRRRFSPQFKAEAVQMVLETGKPIAEVARDLGINEGTLGNWVNLWRRDNPEPVPDLNPVEGARVKEMEDEIRRLRVASHRRDLRSHDPHRRCSVLVCRRTQRRVNEGEPT